MTLLTVHDEQQGLTIDFVRFAQRTFNKDGIGALQYQAVYDHGQELGFCNDEIKVLLEDILPK